MKSFFAHIDLFKIAEIISFIFLLILSAFLTQGCISQFLSGKTSFSITEIQLYEHPTITLCFGWATKPMKYGSDFTIEYVEDTLLYSSPFTLQIGENIKNEAIVHLEEILTLEQKFCYNISAVHTPRKGHLHRLDIYFNKNFPQEYVPPFLLIYITSRNNSYGIVLRHWFDGKVTNVKIDKGYYKDVSLTPEQHKFIRPKPDFDPNDCRHESFIECFKNLAVPEVAKNCPKTCSPFSMPNVPLCETDEDRNCSKNTGKKLYILLTRNSNYTNREFYLSSFHQKIPNFQS